MTEGMLGVSRFLTLAKSEQQQAAIAGVHQRMNAF